ncbi:MAG: hypothetical protein AAF620_01150 [Bacteroidota bacterium]
MKNVKINNAGSVHFGSTKIQAKTYVNGDATINISKQKNAKNSKPGKLTSSMPIIANIIALASLVFK